MWKKEVQDQFDYFDKDGSGIIDKKEFQEVMNKHHSSEDVALLMTDFDKDNNGEISKEEFSAAVANLDHETRLIVENMEAAMTQ